MRGDTEHPLLVKKRLLFQGHRRSAVHHRGNFRFNTISALVLVFFMGLGMGLLAGGLIVAALMSQMTDRYHVVQKQMVMSSGTTKQVLYKVDRWTGRAWEMCEGHWTRVAQK